jgi:hypothetical protein
VSEEHSSLEGFISASAISGLLDMLNRACGEFSEVKQELKEVTSIKYDLTSVRESQGRNIRNQKRTCRFKKGTR